MNGKQFFPPSHVPSAAAPKFVIGAQIALKGIR